MTVQTALKTWGNSQGILLPKKVLEVVGWQVSDELVIDAEPGGLHIYGLPRRKSLAERLAEYNNQLSTFHYDWGEPKGKELL